jgi:hypothetical protein
MQIAQIRWSPNNGAIPKIKTELDFTSECGPEILAIEKMIGGALE